MKLKIAGLALAACGLAALALASPCAAAKELEADALTKTLMKKPEFEQVSISPDGSKLALARRIGDTMQVSVHQRSDMAPLISFDPGARGEITELRWIDDARLLVGATRRMGPEDFAGFDPVLVIATLDGQPPTTLPGDLFSFNKDDPQHLLVGSCGYGPGNKGCNLPQVRRDEIGKLMKKGELVIEGPADTRLVLNTSATAGFAVKWEDDDSSKLYVYKPADKTWSLVNDGSASGLEVLPIGVSRDGTTGYLEAERKGGPDAIEKYDFATGTRTPLYADPHSDPISTIGSFDKNEIIGAVYEPTDPRQQFWAPEHPEARLRAELQAAFHGRNVEVSSRSADNNLLVLGVSSDRDPGTWYLFDRKARKASVITRQYPWIDPAAQATQVSIELKSRDGLALHGLLTLPPNSAGKNLPLVVTPHGGPFWVLDHKGYDVENQILAQHGYAVLQVNFRGSGGYGRDFFNAGTRQWGTGMLDDIIDATRWAIAQGIADPARICIYGVSYGGYAALETPIREPGLFRCIASYAGPTELTRMTRWDSQHRDELSKKWFAKMLGEVDTLAPISPALNAGKIKVPVLLAHGYRDARVGVRHAQAMHSQLEKQHVPVDYIEYSDTGHYLWLDRHREDFYARLLRLLDQNIGAGAAQPAAPATN